MPKDTVDEDVEQKRKASSPKASVVAADEVHDEENNGFDYEDDEFEVTRLLLHMSNNIFFTLFSFICPRASVLIHQGFNKY